MRSRLFVALPLLLLGLGGLLADDPPQVTGEGQMTGEQNGNGSPKVEDAPVPDDPRELPVSPSFLYVSAFDVELGILETTFTEMVYESKTVPQRIVNPDGTVITKLVEFTTETPVTTSKRFLMKDHRVRFIDGTEIAPERLPMLLKPESGLLYSPDPNIDPAFRRLLNPKGIVLVPRALAVPEAEDE